MTENKPFVFYSDKLNFKAEQTSEGTRYFVGGYISTGDLDLVNDIVTKNCMESMDAQFEMRSIKLDFEHEAFRGDSELDQEAAKTRIPLGKAIESKRDAKGVLVEWELNSTWKKFDSKGDIVMGFKDLWRNVEEGYYDAFSIAYIPTKTTMLERDGKTIRLLDDVNLLNVALTGNAINPDATINAVMAKSLQWMNDNELNTKNKGDLMTEEEKAKAEAEAKAKAEEEAKAKAEAEAKAKETAEAKAKADAEAKSLMVDMKSRLEKVESEMKDFAELKGKVETLEKENKDMKDILEKARPKGNGAEDPDGKKKAEGKDAEMYGPLDAV